MTLKEIQQQQIEWLKHNFPEYGPDKAYWALLGIVEEVGELARSYHKKEEGIRGTPEEHDEKMRDAVGDIMLFLLSFCYAKGWDCEDIVNEVWSRVGKRDFIKDPINGGE
jgi:NTP pyrophosphatase (non-canonical NTP hydrolase)